ncbi:hypothetical protein [Candidatus Avelusimicrobium stercoris]|uniref:hypothetical protein n=1 Tax=Candidatus Avelusimicrobium stercoris TaxID=1947924 RepID=UPI003D1489DD
MKKERKDTGLIGAAGVYELLSRLSRRGWVATMTPGNTQGVDVLAYKTHKGKLLVRQIEVKTCNKSKPIDSKFWGKSIFWQMNKKHEKAMPNVWYCFVNFDESFDVKTGKPLPKETLPHTSVYLVSSKQVAKFTKESHPKWLKNPEAKKEHKDTDLRRFCLGFAGEKYTVKSTLMAEKCRERWNLLEKGGK